MDKWTKQGQSVNSEFYPNRVYKVKTLCLNIAFHGEIHANNSLLVKVTNHKCNGPLPECKVVNFLATACISIWRSTCLHKHQRISVRIFLFSCEAEVVIGRDGSFWPGLQALTKEAHLQPVREAG